MKSSFLVFTFLYHFFVPSILRRFTSENQSLHEIECRASLHFKCWCVIVKVGMHSSNTAKIPTWFLFLYLSFSFFFTLQSHALYPHSTCHTHTVLSTTPTRTAPSLTSYLFRHSTLPYLTRSHFYIFLAGQSPGLPMWNQNANTNPNPYGMPQMPSFAPSTAYSPPAVADPLTTYASQVPYLLKKNFPPYSLFSLLPYGVWLFSYHYFLCR